MKPLAPLLPLDSERPDEPSLQSEITRICDERIERGHDRLTVPAPPAPDTLRAATPDFRHGDENQMETIPMPPPSSSRVQHAERVDVSADDGVPMIPGPPRVPRIAGL